MAKKKDEITIRSSAAEYLTYVASVGDQQDSICLLYTSCAENSIYEINEMLKENGITPLGSDPGLQ